MQCSHTGSKKPNASSVMAPTNSNTINTLLGVVKQTIKLTLLSWKLSRANYAPIPSNVSYAKSTHLENTSP